PFNNSIELRGNLQRAGAASVHATGVLVTIQLHTQRFAESLHRAAPEHRPPLRTFLHNLQPVLLRERANLRNIVRASTVSSRKFFARKVMTLHRSRRAQ